MSWPFTRYGTGTLLLCSGALLAAVLLLARLPGAWWVLPLPLLAFFLNFFRDPERRAPGGEDELVAPADGLVADIVQVDDPDLGERATRIGIFLSVFDVHVNRTCCAGEIVAVSHRAGECLDARHPKATELNRAATIVLRRPDGRRLALRQITGKIARRIVCPAQVGDRLARGERYGMIRFGSRTELVVPVGEAAELLCKAGDTVRGGQTLVLRLRPAGARGAARAEAGATVAR
ncbi:MAG TPA: phosphatidylserine decarboxylase [Planctomycetota bacterium]|nr:phosphatidylserine decarboxylase [Planctomycetota bacterium]